MKLPLILLLAAFIMFILLTAMNNADAQNEQTKALVQERCTKCHNLSRVRARLGKLDKVEWHTVLTRMQKNGAMLTDEEKGEVAGFLTAQTSPNAL